MLKDSEWKRRMNAKGYSDEQISEIMKSNRAKAKNHSKGGFRYLKENDPDRLKRISSEGGKAAHERNKMGDAV